MASIGDQLRQAREAQGLSVAEVVDQTKMMTDQIHALEAGDWSAFAAPVYMRGFVSNYAGLLKLDVEEIRKGLEAELAAFFRLPVLVGMDRRQLIRVDVVAKDPGAALGILLHRTHRKSLGSVISPVRAAAATE